jgi:hypothetical protein
LELLYLSRTDWPEHQVVCFPSSKVFCGGGECKADIPVVFNLLGSNEWGQTTMSRCDKNGCDTYDAVAEGAGDFLNVQTIAPRGMMFKSSKVSGEYIEIATLGLGAFISFGYCK